MVVMGLILSSGMLPASIGGWRDDFDGATLHDRWRQVIPHAGPIFSLTESPGRLRVGVPSRKGGFDLWVPEDKAPRLLTDAPGGDFVYEGRVRVAKWSPDGNVQVALVVAFSEGCVLSWGPFYSKIFGDGQKTPEVAAEATGLGNFGKAPGDARDVWLRIAKTGRRYAMSLKRKADAEWKQAASFDAAFPARYVGLMVKTYGDRDNAAVGEIDYVSLTTQSAGPPGELTARVHIAADKPDAELNPFRYGHFIEHMHKCIYGGFWAERLYNRKFTGAATDGVIERWQAVGRREGVTFARDNHDFYCPSQAQVVEATQGSVEHGIQQGNIAIEAGREYTGYVIAKQSSLDGPVAVSLRSGDKLYASARIGPITRQWKKHTFTLKASADAINGAFAITTTSPGKLWLGAVSLMPADNVSGWRRDVIEACKLCRPPICRYPGGNFVSGYHWQDGIGPRDRRPPRFDRAWHAWEWNDVGIDEFMVLTELIGWAPYICVNCGEGQSDEAAAWVEYCNGGPETRWGKVRAANGHREPYGIKVWGIGNEIYGPWQLGHLDATKYALKAVEFARAMKAADPTIKLVGVGVEVDQFDDWNRKVVEIAGHVFDWHSVHHYYRYDVRGDRRASYGGIVRVPIDIERMLRKTADIVRRANGGVPIPLAFDEWNVAPFRLGGKGEPWRYNIAEGLYAAGVFHVLHRLAREVTMANLTQLVNVLGELQVRQTAVLETPTFLAIRLYANTSGHRRIPVELTDVPKYGHTPLVDVIAALGEDGQTLHVHAINRHPTASITVDWRLTGFQPAGPVRVTEMTGASWQSTTTFAKPDGVRLIEREASWDALRNEPLGPHSVRGMVIPGR